MIRDLCAYSQPTRFNCHFFLLFLVVSLLQVTLSSMSLWARFPNSLHQCKPSFGVKKNYWQYLLKAQSEKLALKRCGRTLLHMHLYQFLQWPSSVQHNETSTAQWKQRIQATTQRNEHNTTKLVLCVVTISLCCALLGHCKFPFQMQNLLKGEYLKESRNMIYEGLL